MTDPDGFSWPLWLTHANSPYGQFLRAALARLEAEQVERRAWVDGLAAKYGVVRLAASLTPEQLEAQNDRVELAMGFRFHPTEPYPGISLADGTWQPGTWPAGRGRLEGKLQIGDVE
jgi:hypothetical protein